MRVFVFRPGIFGDGAFEGETLAGLHVVEMRGHGAIGVFFDDEIKVADGSWRLLLARLYTQSLYGFVTFVARRGVRSDSRLLHLRTFVHGEKRS